MLEISRIKKTYEKQQVAAVNNLSFTLQNGHVLGLIGESGAGKTTTLKLLAGLLEPDNGKVLLNGEKLLGPKDKLIPGHKEIQMVFQQFELSPNFTVYENIRHPVLNSNKQYRSTQINKVLKLCELEHLQHRLPKQISGGQQQRVALARALVNEPKVLLLDEPFSNLDKPRRNHFLRLIRKIASETGTSVIFVTHEANDALAVADQLIVMRNGLVTQKGTPQKLYHFPINSYVARFFGEMNIFPMEDYRDFFKEESTTMGNYFGIRPEHIYLEKYNGELQGKIEAIMFFGSYSLLTIRTDKYTFIINYVGKDNPQKDEVIYLRFDKKQIKYFWE